MQSSDVECAGDYDGDRVDAYWKPEFVKHFTNADPDKSLVGESAQMRLSEDTAKDQTTVAEFFEAIPSDASDEDRIYRLQKYLLAASNDIYSVGTISEMWLKCVYTHGYDNPKTIHLSNLYVTVAFSVNILCIDRHLLFSGSQQSSMAQRPVSRCTLAPWLSIVMISTGKHSTGNTS